MAHGAGEFDIDELREGESVLQHLIAGAFAGTAEHCAMFPIDTIKVCSCDFLIDWDVVIPCA